jgi:nicotinate-nucleotide adenylyltransferase
MKRIGIYAGTFDPVHNGHVGFALAAKDAAKLDEVVFLPEKVPRGKQHVTGLTHRFALLQRALAPYHGLTVRLLNVDQFCVRGTLPALREMFGDAALVLLLGSDVVKTFPDRWANLDELFSAMELVIGLREGDTGKDMQTVFRHLDTHVKPRYLFVESPMAKANSTMVRAGVVVRDLSPEVSHYIKQHHLYRRAV